MVEFRIESLAEAKELECAEGHKKQCSLVHDLLISKKGKAMQTAEMTRSETEVWAMIQELDLDPIKVKLMDAEEGEGWTLEKADEVEKWYKRFLLLNFKYPDKHVVPPKSVDTFWHQHILDTRKYHEDCEQVFGYFLHHFPYFGMRGEEDAADLERAFDETLALFYREYGERSAVCGDERRGVTCYKSAATCCSVSGCNDAAGHRPRLVRTGAH